MIDGLLPVDKPAGWTSHDVVARLRRLAGQRQVGHAGTLDPLATGVLLLVLGRATRLSSYLMVTPKVYCADVVLGATTATDDAEAPLQTQRDASHIQLGDVEQCVQRFKGTIRQVPPAYAAVRQGGQKLYVLARKGQLESGHITPQPRSVTVHHIGIENWQPPRVRLKIRCGAGTYVRALARDIGAALGVGGYLHALRRMASGSFTVSQCQSIETLSDREAVQRSIFPPDHALLDRPALVLSAAEVRAVRTGQPITLEQPEPGEEEGRAPGGEVRLYTASGTLIALARLLDSRQAKPFRVFDGGSELDADRL